MNSPARFHSMVEIIPNLQWQPRVGDPTLVGWLTVAAFLAAAFFSAVCARAAGRVYPGKPGWIHRLVWGSLAAAMLFLGVNKQLDLQSLFAQVGRQVALQQGWYEVRQSVQTWVIVVMAGLSAGALACLLWILRRFWRVYWPVLIGLLFLARFIIVRAATFWGVPLPQLSRLTGGIRIIGLLEILGAALICLSAWNFLIHLPKSPSLAAISPSGTGAR